MDLQTIHSCLLTKLVVDNKFRETESCQALWEVVNQGLEQKSGDRASDGSCPQPRPSESELSIDPPRLSLPKDTLDDMLSSSPPIDWGSGGHP
jgi:hypothetical protein